MKYLRKYNESSMVDLYGSPLDRAKEMVNDVMIYNQTDIESARDSVLCNIEEIIRNCIDHNEPEKLEYYKQVEKEVINVDHWHPRYRNRKVNESNEETDIDFIIAKIKEEYPINDVENMYNEEKDAWSDDYDNEGNGEAEDVILNKLLGWFQKQYSKELSDETFDEAYSKLQDVYEFLKH